MSHSLLISILLIFSTLFISCERDFVKISGIDRSSDLSGNLLNKSPPSLNDIANGAVDENETMLQIDINDGEDDLDADGQPITYSCYYDMIIDDTVSDDTLCSDLENHSFDNESGTVDWTPDFTQAGIYEFKITATDGTFDTSVIFIFTVNNIDAPPILDTISDQSLSENTPITQIDASDDGDDTDIDTNVITYSCYYDTIIDAAVADSSSCTSLAGVNFMPDTGVMNWIPNYSQANTYEFKITGSEGDLSDFEIFSITVNNIVDNTAPVINSFTVEIDETNLDLAKEWKLDWEITDNLVPNSSIQIFIYRKFSNDSSDFPDTNDELIHSSSSSLTPLNDVQDETSNPDKFTYANYRLIAADADANPSTATASINSLYAKDLITVDEGVCVLINNGDIVCWGNSGYIGTGVSGLKIGLDYPVGTHGKIDIGGKAIQLKGGERLICAIREDYQVFCWGGGTLPFTSDFRSSTSLGGVISNGNLNGDLVGSDETPLQFGYLDVLTTDEINDGDIVINIYPGDTYVCAELLSGKFRCWGGNRGGYIGGAGSGYENFIGNDEPPKDAPFVNFGTDSVVQFKSRGSNSACIINQDKDVKCWGVNLYGITGYGDSVSTNSIPVDTIPLGSGAVAIDLHTMFSCALLENNEVKCWGYGSYGSLGYRSDLQHIGDNESIDTVGYVQVLSPAERGDGKEVLSVFAGVNTCAIVTGGQFRCWGRNSYFSAGYGNLSLSNDDYPYENGNVPIGNLYTHKIANKVASYNCGLFNNGIVKCWGRGMEGQLGTLGLYYLWKTPEEIEPINYLADASTTIPQVFHGELYERLEVNTSLEITLPKAFGSFSNPINLSYSLVSVSNGTVTNCLNNDLDLTCTYTPSTDYIGDDLIRYRVTDQDGDTVDNNFFITVYDPSDIDTTFIVTDVSLISRKQNGASACFKISGGDLTKHRYRCLGNEQGLKGYAGTGSIIKNEYLYLNSYLKILSDTERETDNYYVEKITNGTEHYCALIKDDDVANWGRVRCWGYGAHGQLGYASTTSTYNDEDPYISFGDVRVLSDAERTAGRYITDVQAGGEESCALIDNGTIRCWGYGYSYSYGENVVVGDDEHPYTMGDVQVFSPAEKSAGRSVLKLAVGKDKTCILTDQKKLRCYGRSIHYFGIRGSGTINYNLGEDELPYETDPPEDYIKVLSSDEIAAGGTIIDIILSSSLAYMNFPIICTIIKVSSAADQSLRCWDNAVVDQPYDIGDVDLNGEIPLVVDSSNGVCAVTTIGNLYCWGSNKESMFHATFNLVSNYGKASTNSEVGGIGPIDFGGKKVINVSTAENNICAVFENGGVKCWGHNSVIPGYKTEYHNLIGDNESIDEHGYVLIFDRND